MTITPVKRALLSVSDKTGLIEFARKLHKLGVALISTGGTSQALEEAGIPHQQVDEITGLPAMLDGRVKTLHPKVHGGILGKRDVHAAEAALHQIDWIDLVVVNFYPFEKSPSIENIDIGGPTMVRAAAKNYAWVGVVVHPSDYSTVINEMEAQQGLTLETRKRLARKVFALTSHYDHMIHHYFLDESAEQLNLQLEKSSDLRYGENPHQKASAYRFPQKKSSILSAKQHQGKPLSFNNILDAEAAWSCLHEFAEPACVIVKHANPCGAATSKTIEEAYLRAYQADSLSAFGGIVALNRPCTKAIAQAMASVFVEVVLAPSYTQEALDIFSAKHNLRVLEVTAESDDKWEMKFVSGGVLMQEKDMHRVEEKDLKVVTRTKPNAEEMSSMLFAWRVVKHIKSNGILIAKNDATVGVGAGQVSRVDAVDLAIRKAGEGTRDAVLASDAFFPFRDSIDRLAKTGVRAIIQPGGSVRDDEVVAACDEHGIAMVFTGVRCFRH